MWCQHWRLLAIESGKDQGRASHKLSSESAGRKHYREKCSNSCVLIHALTHSWMRFTGHSHSHTLTSTHTSTWAHEHISLILMLSHAHTCTPILTYELMNMSHCTQLSHTLTCAHTFPNTPVHELKNVSHSHPHSWTHTCTPYSHMILHMHFLVYT